MGLRIIVLVKQVPDTNNITADAMRADGTVNRSALPAIFNPEDLNALEEALKIKETVSGTTIVAITLGPPSAVKVLKECLYRGVDDVILVTDPKFAASDTLATSYALKCAIDNVGKYDLILCGRQAIDGDTAQVGPQVAEKLKINQITNATAIHFTADNKVKVRRSIDSGYEIIASALPVLITITDEANEPRSRSARRVMMYKNIACQNQDTYNDAYLQIEPNQLCAHIKQWDAKTIKAIPDNCGLAGSPTKVKNIENVVLTARDTKQITTNKEDINNLINELITEHIIG